MEHLVYLSPEEEQELFTIDTIEQNLRLNELRDDPNVRLKRKERHYTPDFIGICCALAESNGWPLRMGAISRTKKQTGVPTSTLIAWLKGNRRNSKDVQVTRAAASEALADLFTHAAGEYMNNALENMDKMTAYQRGILASIAVDKVINLTGGQRSTLTVEVLHKMEHKPAPWSLQDGDDLNTIDGKARQIEDGDG